VKRICVFSGSRPGFRPAYAKAARDLGEAIARAGMGLVYGGASVGLMNDVAEAALANGAEVIGVIPRSLADREVAHHGLTELRVVETMHERKALMYALSDGFVVLPGGFGTLDEMFEVLTWAQLGMHDKPIALFNVEGFWEPLTSLLQHFVREGFVPDDQLALVSSDIDARALVTKMQTWTKPTLGPKWLDKA
jgi:uncharacterized protein (TIGR00730 family)